MRILQVITDTDRRGGQVFGVDLGRALEARGHDVRTVALAPGTGARGLDVPVLGTSRLGVATLHRLRKELRDHDVAIAHGSSTLPACALAGVGSTPFVYRQIGNSKYWAPTVAKRVRVGMLLRRARAVVALSPAARDLLVSWFRVPVSRVHVAPNGVDGRRFSPAAPADRDRCRTQLGLDRTDPVVLYVGSLEAFKGVDAVIRAAAQSGPSAVLLVVGAGPDRAALEALADDLLPGRVHFLGLVDDVVPTYMAADVVVLPFTGADSMPATVIEAGLCGVPVVTTPVGAIPEVVVDGETAVLVPTGDEASLVAATSALLDDPARARAIGLAARQSYLERFDIAVVAAAWERVLTAVVDPGRS